MLIKSKPLSVNEAWKGRRYRSDKYNLYIGEMLIQLPKNMKIPDGEFCIACRWGFSNYGASDFDNPIKPFIDCLQKRYGINDKYIKQGLIEKVRTKKGEEFIEFFLYEEPISFDSLRKYEYR